jgi:hypothetical protein
MIFCPKPKYATWRKNNFELKEIKNQQGQEESFAHSLSA